MNDGLGKWALVTGASSGIGYHLALRCADDGYGLVICADNAEIFRVADELKARGIEVLAVRTDLGREDGVAELCRAAREHDIQLLLANAGIGLGEAFLDQDLENARRVVDINVQGTLSLIHKVGTDLRRRGRGRILITGSIAGLMPGSFQAVYNGTKAFLDSFSFALANELKGTGVSVTCLMPGPTDTDFFKRAGMEDTGVGQRDKDDPADVAKTALCGNDGRRDQRGYRLHEQGAGGFCRYHSRLHACPDAPPHGGTSISKRVVGDPQMKAAFRR